MRGLKTGASWILFWGAAWLAGGVAVAQEACGDHAGASGQEPDVEEMAVLGEEDLAERAEIWRNRYRRMTPGAEPLVQDIGTWPAAWEE